MRAPKNTQNKVVDEFTLGAAQMLSPVYGALKVIGKVGIGQPSRPPSPR